MAKVKETNFLNGNQNPFLTSERENIWKKMKESEQAVSKEELLRKSEVLRKDSKK